MKSMWVSSSFHATTIIIFSPLQPLSPQSFGTLTSLDRKVKLPLIEDLLDLLDLESSSLSLSPSDDKSLKREKQNSLPRCSEPRDSTPRRYKISSVTRPLDPQTRIRSRAKHANRADNATDEGLNQRLLFSQGGRHNKGRLIEQGNRPLNGESVSVTSLSGDKHFVCSTANYTTSRIEQQMKIGVCYWNTPSKKREGGVKGLRIPGGVLILRDGEERGIRH